MDSNLVFLLLLAAAEFILLLVSYRYFNIVVQEKYDYLKKLITVVYHDNLRRYKEVEEEIDELVDCLLEEDDSE